MCWFIEASSLERTSGLEIKNREYLRFQRGFQGESWPARLRPGTEVAVRLAEGHDAKCAAGVGMRKQRLRRETRRQRDHSCPLARGHCTEGSIPQADRSRIDCQSNGAGVYYKADFYGREDLRECDEVIV